METGNPNALKFGTQEGGVRAHLGTNFHYNTINNHKDICDYSQKITPICCHTHRVNHEWQEAENWYRGRLTIEPQTFYGLKVIELKIMKMQDAAKKLTVCKNYTIENY